MSGNTGETVTLPSEVAQGIPNAWLEGYIKGNRLWPQTNFGFTIFTTAAILERPPQQVDQLTQVVLSQEQTKQLTELASGIHKKMSIGRTIYPHHIQQLWYMARSSAVNLIADLAVISEQFPSQAADTNEELSYLFAHPESPAFQFAKQVVIQARDILSDVEAIKLASLYLQQYDVTLSPTERAKHDPKYRGKLSSFDIDPTDTSINTDLKGKCTAIARAMVGRKLGLHLNEKSNTIQYSQQLLPLTLYDFCIFLRIKK